ncbi:MAG: hypothetical protein WA765_19805 [Candidatus Acidiferrum sp.]
MRRLVSATVALLIALSVPGYSPGQTKLGAATPAAAAPSPIELTISGPRYIRRGDDLNFKVTLTNRSDKPVAVRSPFLFGEETRFLWRITDHGGRLLPPHIYDQVRGICPVTGPVMDFMIIVLQPGEKMDYPFAGDPSDSFVFPGKGFYRVTLNYVLAPTQYVTVAPFRPPDEKPGAYTPQQKVEMIKTQPRFETVSNVWQMYLGD